MSELKTLYALREREAHEDKPYDTSTLPTGWAETIIKVVEGKGSTDAGDFPSKHARDVMISEGYLANICWNGEQVGTVATYKGGYLYSQLVGSKSYGLADAIKIRKANPNFLNELWKSQQPGGTPYVPIQP
jgi:hypothetical protein